MEQKFLSNKEDQAYEIVKQHTFWSIGAGLIPIPVLDIVSVTAIQLDMLKSICELYGVNYSKEQGKSWISALAGATLSSVLSRMGASAVKSIPGLGTVIGTASMAVLSGATTYGLGAAAIYHVEKEGNFVQFNTEKIKKLYDEKMEEGKKIASNLKEKYKKYVKSPKGKAAEESAVEKLKKLDELKKQNLISEEEYNSMRKEILDDFMKEEHIN